MPKLPLTVLMITKNEEFHIADSISHLKDFASEIIIVDSFSIDNTVDIAISLGAKVIQRKFKNFGDQWNFAVNTKEISNPWCMKLDPDERLTKKLKKEIKNSILENNFDGFYIRWDLWFMGKPLKIKSKYFLRIWKTGKCKFSNDLVNEHPKVNGLCSNLKGFINHLDSENLDQWYMKQNIYSTLEAKSLFMSKIIKSNQSKIFNPKKRNIFNFFYSNLPFKNFLLFNYFLFIVGSYKGGKVGIIWAKLRVEVYKMREYKYLEMKLKGKFYEPTYPNDGPPNKKAIQSK